MARTDADYFKPSRRDDAIARAPRQMPVATVEQIRAMVIAMPTATAVERRNRARAMVTLTSYGTLPGYTQRELIAGIAKRGRAT